MEQKFEDFLTKCIIPASSSKTLEHTHTWFSLQNSFPRKLCVKDEDELILLRQTTFDYISQNPDFTHYVTGPNSVTEKAKNIFRFFVDLDWHSQDLSNTSQSQLFSDVKEIVSIFDKFMKSVTQGKSSRMFVAMRSIYKVHLHFPDIIVNAKTSNRVCTMFKEQLANDHQHLFKYFEKGLITGKPQGIDTSVYKTGLRMLFMHKGSMLKKKSSVIQNISSDNVRQVYQLVDPHTFDWLIPNIQHLIDTSIIAPNNVSTNLTFDEKENTPNLTKYIKTKFNITKINQNELSKSIDKIENNDKLTNTSVSDFAKSFVFEKWGIVLEHNPKIDFKFKSLTWDTRNQQCCPFTKKSHVSNNVFVIMNKTNIQLRCYDQDCLPKKHSVRSKFLIAWKNIPEQIKKEYNAVFVVSGNSSTSDSGPNLSTEDQVAIVRTQAMTAYGEDHPNIDWDLSQTKYDDMNGWRLPFSSKFCPKCNEEHDSPQAYIQCNRQGLLTIACRQTDTMLPPVRIPDNVANNLFVTIVNNYNGQPEIREPRDFGNPDAFPISIVNNDKELALLCFDSLDGSTSSVADFLRHMIKGKYLWLDHQWYHYNGTRWKPHPGPHVFVSKDVAKIYANLQDFYSTDNQIKWLQNLVNDMKNLPKRKAYIEELEIILESEEDIPILNHKNHLIPFNNGTFDTEKMIFRDHHFEDYISNVIPYDLPAETNIETRQQIDKFFMSIIPNESVRKFLLTFLAIHLEGKNRHQMAVIMTGTGSNGKGVLKTLMKETFAFFHDEPSASLLTNERPSDESPCANLVRLQSKRSVFMSEPEQSKKINGAFLKFLTGADTVTARNLNSPNYVEYVPMFTPTLLCNGIPKIDGGSEDVNGIWRRLKIIDFPVQFSAVGPFDELRQPIDDSLGTKVKSWAPEFMLMLIEIFSQYCENRNALLIPEEVNRQVEIEKRENNPLLRFLEETLEPMENAVLHVHRLNEHFEAWYRQNYKGPLPSHFSSRFLKTRLLAANGMYKISDVQKKSKNCQMADGSVCRNPNTSLLGWKVKDELVNGS
ncbi:hypothetical protein BDK51DRAFT_30601 [Blyttiomyces helicus]|uniref:SF3 helicase domain-containing protein n=1 Tax=Blyttiomyces helicus TaxID=388810 RepID=A0A4P9WMM2_9FUNG|nr:hypothetical protein BDK51DRAFT_30601 [Blyttiomyces helicus]|eukprot:RKO91986.1 hypothetical protein BDK51DRAFT_30601 [Blyttiomyces helicus]